MTVDILTTLKIQGPIVPTIDEFNSVGEALSVKRILFARQRVRTGFNEFIETFKYETLDVECSNQMMMEIIWCL